MFQKCDCDRFSLKFDDPEANHYKVYGQSVDICATAAEPIEVPFGLWTLLG